MQNECSNIERLILIVTNRCNSRCYHCNIWKECINRKTDIPIEIIIEKIKYNNGLENLKRINISGGEPTLYPDFDKLFNHLGNEFGKKLLISTISNGIEKNLLFQFARQASEKNRLQLFISLDAIDGVTYSKIRGVDAFDIVKSNLLQLIRINKDENLGIRLGVSFTITNLNFNQTFNVWEFTQRMGIDFITRIAITKKDFYNISNGNSFELSESEMQETQNFLDKIVYKDEGMSQSQKWFLNNMKKGISGFHSIDCSAGNKSLCIRTNLDVSPCLFVKKPIANLEKSNFTEICLNAKNYFIKHLKNCQCWNDCETISNYEYINLDNSPTAGW